jgi:nitroimidazol reductase NimA-like FMN-containing flavoprotein (pyridoxamine 5'-phosphate oxidase superfamily)
MATEVPQQVLDYLSAEKTLTLATTSDDGIPHASTFMYVNHGLSLYIWARPTSTTVKHVRHNPRVSFTIDEYVEDWNKAKGIQGDGKCEAVTVADEIVQLVGSYSDKFPSPTSGASTTHISFFRITPTKLQFIDNGGEKVAVAQDEFGAEFFREELIFGD